MQLDIIHILINSFICFGIYKAFDDGMIFGKIGTWLHSNYKTVAKPLITCPICMSSVWGTAYFWLLTDMHLWLWPLHVLAVAGVNRILLYLSVEWE